jgi:DNA-binding NarL/FixJ family response regulator
VKNDPLPTAAAAGTLSRAQDGLLGRSAELALGQSLLQDPAPSGAAALFVGGPGSGKTALLGELARSAAENGALVLSATGDEAEAQLPYAGLSQLLRPALADVAELDSAHQRALDRVLRIGAPVEQSDTLVAMAVLNLLELLAAAQFTVLVLDDLQWIDRRSSELLSFVRRRLTGLRVALLAAAREPVLTPDPITQVVSLPPLEASAARELLERHAGHLEPHLRELLLHEAAGNPLALVELPRTVSNDDLPGLLNAALPVNRRIEQSFARRLRDLPPEAGRLLLLLACLDSTELAELAAAAEAEGLDLAGLDDAEAAGLITMPGQQVVFPHPLIRSVIYQAASPGSRRSAHRTLAGVLAGQPERAVWHRAVAATGVDEQLAGELERLSSPAPRRETAAAVAAALERAAELSTDPVARARRLAAAADAARAAGRYAAAASLLDRVELSEADEATRLSVASQHGWQLLDNGDVDAALEVLVSAAETAVKLDPPAAARPAAIAALARWLSGNRAADDRLAAVVRIIQGGLNPASAPPLVLMAAAASDLTDQPAEIGAAIKRAAETLGRTAGTINSAGSAWEIARLADAALMVQDITSAQSLYRAAAQQMRAVGSFGALATVLTSNARADLAAGSWTSARQLATEALEIATVAGQHRQAAFCRVTLAHLAAAGGESDTVEELTASVLAWAQPRHQRLVTALAGLARIRLELGNADYDAAAGYLPWLRPAAASQAGEILLPAACAEVVESLVRAGKPEQAREILDWVELRRRRWPDSLLTAATARARAVLLEPGEDEPAIQAAYEQAVTATTAESAFEQARIRLNYGSWLRRRRQINEARTQLRIAEEIFSAYQATPWVQRCGNELRAAGLGTGEAGPANFSTLTSQEQLVAELAAEGLSNREIGERLFLSARTVGSHLYKAYPKLGISNRAQLRAALQRRDQPGGSSHSD